VTALWLAVRLVAWASGERCRQQWGFDPLVAIVQRDTFAAGVCRSVARDHLMAVGVSWAVLTAVPLLLAGWLIAAQQGRRPAADDPLRSLADDRAMRDLTVTARAREVVRLLPSLAGSKPAAVKPALTGRPLGRLRTLRARQGGTELRAGFEDVAVAVMAPRAGKTTGLAVPWIMQAPGAVIATSNRADLLPAVLLRARREKTPVYVFDPQGIGRVAQELYYDILADVTSPAAALRLADQFATSARRGHSASSDVWDSAARSVLAALLLAASLDGRTIVDVAAAVNATDLLPSAETLIAAGYPAMAATLTGTASDAAETRSGVMFTIRAGIGCLTDPEITQWVTPQPGLPALNPAALLAERGTLLMMSKDSGASAAPLLAALADELFRVGTRAAESLGGRLDPPVTAVLDEAANVCPIHDLPKLYSHLGGRLFGVLTILQSRDQARAVWGNEGAGALWSAATIKLVGAGLDDAAFAEDLSRLVGEHDVATVSVSNSGSGLWSTGRSTHQQSTSVRQQRILTAGQIRGLDKNTALLIATGHPTASIRLCPSYEADYAAELADMTQRVTDAVTAAGA
jgi:type IV secretory pathway TraG/TraD family ATPase VirD4